MRSVKTIVTIVVVALAAACAYQAPVEQVQLFRQAFTNVQTASQPLFDDLAAAERDLGKRVAVSDAQVKLTEGETPPIPPNPIIIAPAETQPATETLTENTRAEGETGADQQAAKPLPAITVRKCYETNPGWQSTRARDDENKAPGFIDGFCLEDSAYFANVGDPPATRAFRHGVEVLGLYSEILLILAEGRNIDEAKAQLSTLGASIAGTLAIIPGTQAPAALIVPVLDALDKIVEEAAKAQNFKEMTRLVTDAGPKFVRLIAALKASSPWFFETLIRSPARKVPLQTHNNPELAKTVVNQIEGYRMAVSNFVVLLDEMAAAHADIVEALKQAEEAPLTIALLANRVERLNTQANALRDAFVILRRGAE